MSRLNIIRNSLFMLLFYAGLCHGQDGSQIRFQVLDQDTELPIVYATVVLMKARVGVISDDNGNFRIPIIYKTQQDTLKISSIGYNTMFVPLEQHKGDGINIVFLSSKVESLDEISLLFQKNKKKMSAGRIVKEAIKRIPDNYPTLPFSYIGYYRDYQQVADSSYLADMDIKNEHTYINLNEGVIHVFDAGFGTNRLTDELNQTVLYEFQSNENFPVDTLLTIPYDNRKHKYLDGVIISPLGGNELNLLNLTNALRNYNRMSLSFVDIFNRDFLGNHIYQLDSILYLDEIPIYKIDFSSSYSRVNSDYYAKGSVFISKEDFGIYNFDYGMFDSHHNLLYRVNISYKPIGDKYFLNYITFNNYFEVNGGDYFKVIEVVYDDVSSSFQVFFNEAVDPYSMRSWQKQFKFLNNNKLLQIVDVTLVRPDVIKLSIKSSVALNKAIISEGIQYEINKLKDTRGRVLNEQKSLRADQFREIFVQKVFPDSSIDTAFNFVAKEFPLKDSKQNSIKLQETYWINTPLKASK